MTSARSDEVYYDSPSTSPMPDEPTELTLPELSADDFLRIPDDHFTADTVSIVTGAGSGIGQATSVALASNGPTVAGIDIDEAGLEETVEVAQSLDAEDASFRSKRI